jgi:CRISPR-associated protein Csx10
MLGKENQTSMHKKQPILMRVIIEARSPLAFPMRKPGAQFQSSLGYVPGATMYGALGAHCFDRQIPERFERIRCHNAYPMHAGDEWVRPLPATAIQPKGEEQYICDTLVARVCWEQQQPAALIYGPTDQEGRSWEAAGATFYTLRDEALYTRSVTQRVLTRVAINRRRGTAEDQRLYSPLVVSEVTHVPEDPKPVHYWCDPTLPDDKNDTDDQKKKKKTIPEPTRFVGTLCVHPDDNDVVLQALGEITHLGGRQTTGLGAVSITTEARTPETPAAIKSRVDALTARFVKQAELYNDLGSTPEGEAWANSIQPGSIFTINLLSPAILLDQGWLPTNELNADLLRELTGIDATLLRSFTTTTIVGGWNVTWQRPKSTAVATMPGSVFVFQASSTLHDQAYEALAKLQLEGIGERCPEGYGQVHICDAFHLIHPKTKPAKTEEQL